MKKCLGAVGGRTEPQASCSAYQKVLERNPEGGVGSGAEVFVKGVSGTHGAPQTTSACASSAALRWASDRRLAWRGYPLGSGWAGVVVAVGSFTRRHVPPSQ